MEHAIFFNKNCFPAPDRETAIELLNCSLQGVLALNTGEDRFSLFHDSNDGEIANFNLAENYTYANFLEELSDVDLVLFLNEIEDKTPALDFLTEEQLEEAANYQFYIPGLAADQGSDIFSMAWQISATLLSIPTNEKWDHHYIEIARTEDGSYINECLRLNNIARESHGEELRKIYESECINSICTEHYKSKELLAWHAEQTKDNQKRIIEKLSLACQRNFQGGEPLFKNLENAEGIREIRLSAFPGGAIRILFKGLTENKQALLIGFIKKSNSGGYKAAIDAAKDIYKAIH